MRSSARRRELGAFFTPRDVADRLVALALEGLDAPLPRVCDPACGDGVFLLAAGVALERRGIDPRRVARDLLFGWDIDPSAVAAARAAITAWAGVDPGDHVQIGDGLQAAAGGRDRFDAVVGNPPFLNQLERTTVRRAPLPPALASLAGAYTDTAWLFLAVALQLLRPRGRAVLIQPQSLVAARDAGAVRAEVAGALTGLWWCDDRLFDATVRVCAPVLDRGACTSEVARWTGRTVLPCDPVAHPGDAADWSALAPAATPEVHLDARHGTLASLATATAGFRDEFYGLADHVVDDRGGDRPLLVTSGLVDVNAMRWGARPVRFAGLRYEHPRVDVDALHGRLRRWVDARLVPKVVVATQTKVVEAAVDVDGTWVPSTPVIAVHAPPARLWEVAAVLAAPPVSAWARRRSAGAALDRDAIKLAAQDVLTIPLPAGRAAWCDGAEALAAGDLGAAAAAMTSAYGAGDEVFAWWAARLPVGNGAGPREAEGIIEG